MEKEVAREMNALLRRFDELFDLAGALTLRMEDEDEAKAVRRYWGDMFEQSMALSEKVFASDPSLRPADW